MAIFRSFSEIVNSILERLKLTQPNLDTKPGTVSRDLFIDIPADQIEKLYSSLSLVAQKQSPELASGKDLDKWANNFGISRRPGAQSNGIVVFTISSISTDIPIPNGTTITARNGLQYKTIGNYILSSAEKNKFAAIANRLRGGLNIAGITDSFAIEVPVQAMRSGTSGNISSLQIIEHNLPDAVKITNLTAFNGGSNLESDAAFRSRVFAIFSGANTGTAFGYRNAALSVGGVQDAIVVEPGNSLMLRDGTETIEIDDGSFRILNSGTGGKVDIYILGNQLQEITESLIFTDRSGSGDVTDERNDIIVGLQGLDKTLTSEERRVQAFKTGKLPLQPVNSVVSITGSTSGILSEKSIDSSGTILGNYELIKDVNVDTGGSPFGFDKIRFISNYKEVAAENIIKQGFNSIDALRFTDIDEVKNVYQDVQIIKENSTVSSADKNTVKLNHSPIVSVNRILNTTTGESYVISSQNIDSETGLNSSGEIIISGKTLPSTADILSVDYTWRLFFDPYIEYNGKESVGLFSDESVSDSINWGVSNGIFSERTVVEKTDDGFEFQINTDFNISKVVSVYTASSTSATSEIITSENVNIVGVTLGTSDDTIENIISVKNSSGAELYSTPNNDGSFSGKVISFPSDSAVEVGQVLDILYNKIEIFDITNSDASHSNNVITLPSEDILDDAEVLDIVEELYLTGEEIYVKYVANISEVLPSTSLSSLPISGASTANFLFDSGLVQIDNSNQPILYNYDSAGDPDDLIKFGPTRIGITTSGTVRSGKLKVKGTTLKRLELDVLSSLVFDGLNGNIGAYLKDALALSIIPQNMGIARIDSIYSLDNSDNVFEVTGQKLKNINFCFGMGTIDTGIGNTDFVLPPTDINNSIELTSGEMLKISLLVYDVNGYEDLYFPGNNTMITNHLFARIDRISVASGFRSSTGVLVGSLIIKPYGQPSTGSSYSVNYSFSAPKEGERITIKYNLNKLISETTVAVEDVRAITADVLVKEAPQLIVDVSGEIIINSDLEKNSSIVLENVGNAVVKLINSSVLGSTIDYSDLLAAITSVSGVDSANISLFNETNNIGRKTFIKSLDNQNIIAGNISFRVVSRQDFRIT